MFRIVLFLFATALMAQTDPPRIFEGGVVNAASFVLDGLPGASIAQGSMFAIFGTNLGPDPGVAATSFPLPTTAPGLSGTVIRMASGSPDYAFAPLLYAGPGQLTGIMPSSVPVGQVLLSVVRNGVESNSVTVNVVKSSFGIFSTLANGAGMGIIQNFENGLMPFNTIYHSALPGSVAVIWGTGLGPIADPDQQPAPQIALDSGAEVWLAGQRIVPSYQGRTGYFAGLDQINFTLPSNITGCYVPVTVKVGGVASNTVFMSIAPAGGTCSDPIGVTQADLYLAQQGGIDVAHSLKLGLVRLSRQSDAGPLDTGYAWFGSFREVQLTSWRGLTGAPSLGGCVVHRYRGTTPIPVDPIQPTVANPGRFIQLTPAAGSPRQFLCSGGVCSGTLGGNGLSAFLDPGAFQLDNGVGGSGVLAFSRIPFTMGTGITWLNPPSNIARSQNLTITWSGGNSGQEYVQITGYAKSADPLRDAGASFLCSAPADAHSFQVPSYVLGALPAAEGALVVGVASFPFTQRVYQQSTGLDALYPVYTITSSRAVTYQ